jgi:hypothetical protein
MIAHRAYPERSQEGAITYMSSKIWKSAAGLGLLSLLVLGGATRTPAQSASAGKLEGTWFTQVSIRNCQTGAVLRTFPALGTFAQGGTLVDTTTGFSPALRTPGHGSWEKTDGHSYRSVSVAFLFDAAGNWTGIQKLTQKIEVQNDAFTSTATNEILDVNGNVVTTGCATAVGSRVTP